MNRILLVLALALGTTGALAKLPPPSEAQKLKADEAKARAGWADKVAAYQLCRAQDKVAARYYSDMKAKGKEVPEAATGAPCVDPGPFVAQAPAAQGAASIAGAFHRTDRRAFGSQTGRSAGHGSGTIAPDITVRGGSA
ncbi:hypothetical protein [Cupriavidus sp. D39]|uniref:hypothetical protein n=1 Tax=Cupriavidus sp. D39 TaxID=2997877 RepID=UPI002270ED7A|nr:hypothetical protein [Cupriavidus sp. D39]MCY0856253.1 hypothetical protein [Cupriavidus sp. D39]